MKANYYDDGDKVYSYETCILQRVHDGLTIGNATYYSYTTSRHQSKAFSRSADVALYDVPWGVTDLLALALKRDEIDVNTDDGSYFIADWRKQPC